MFKRINIVIVALCLLGIILVDSTLRIPLFPLILGLGGLCVGLAEFFVLLKYRPNKDTILNVKEIVGWIGVLAQGVLLGFLLFYIITAIRNDLILSGDVVNLLRQIPWLGIFWVLPIFIFILLGFAISVAFYFLFLNFTRKLLN